MVTAIQNGTVKITVTASDGSKSSDKCAVTVRTLADSITITGNNVLRYRQTAPMNVFFSPETTSDKRISWSSSDNKAATVSPEGRVTARKVDAATPVIITATARDGSGCFFDYPITVVPPASRIEITPPGTQTIDLTVRAGLKLIAWVSPEDAKDEVTWKSSNTRIASVDASGLITGKRAGSVTITATAKDGSNVFARVKVNVTKLVASVVITGDARVVAGGSTTLKPVFTPADSTNRSVSWKSDNPLVSVSSKGVVSVNKGTSVGTTAKITATCKDAGGASAEYTIIVSPPASSVQITGFSTTPVTMKVGDTLQLAAQVEPEDALERVAWVASPGKLAAISATGLVTAKKAGTVTIIATSADGSRKKVSLQITITK